MKQRGDKSLGDLLYALGERAKELRCIYQIEELLSRQDIDVDALMDGVVKAIPPGWQFPEQCSARVRLGTRQWVTPDFTQSTWVLRAPISIQDRVEGAVEVYYRALVREADEGPFLAEERKLINTIADRLSHHLMHMRLKNIFSEWQLMKSELAEKKREEWKVILDMLRRTDQSLYTRISRKMLNRLCWAGVTDACALMQRYSPRQDGDGADVYGESNKPRQREELHSFIGNSDEIFRIASGHLSEEEILSSIQKWVKDDKAAFLINAVESLDTSFAEIADAIGRYYHIFPDGIELSQAAEKGLRVSLIRRFFTGQLPYINVAKVYLTARDFADIVRCVVFHPKSHGRLGGKSSGLVLANSILKRAKEDRGLFANVRMPKTWYLTSDAVLNFIHYNNLEEVFNQKYLDIEQVREEYPSIVQVFKNSYFSPEIIRGLSMALDDFEEKPLIVRSSSLLEDSVNASFSGKYKSLFLANTGSKEARLSALLDAIAEVYASTFGPDPIEYRAERGLLDFHEEMGIMIQQVVGTRVGDYYFPSWSGVAFSNNEFRWSPRISREDGLLRVVPGLGTRAVDRVTDDYPVLVAPGQPGLRVNVTPDEAVRYSPKMIDVIDLKRGTFETIEITQLLRDAGEHYPQLRRILSRYDGHELRPPLGPELDFENDEYAVTFDGLLNGTNFVTTIRDMLVELQGALGHAVDIEFASDGTDIYLLQCRPQSDSREATPSAIPVDIPKTDVLFTANRYISNGLVPGITHVVYIDPERYAALPDRDALHAVGRAVSRLNKLLPKRQFVLMGPGRWGSRGDIKLGVNVTYSDINNTAMLIEIARQQGNYVPDLSFGTHFFQDLVEASIRYLPLYPDEEGIVFNERWFSSSPNILADIAPEFAELADTVRVIEVAAVADNRIVRILSNAEQGEAVAFIDDPGNDVPSVSQSTGEIRKAVEDHWSWRQRMTERMAAQLPAKAFGVEALYLIGSTKNNTAGPSSDVDLVVHFRGDTEQQEHLLHWFEGWSLCMAEMNFLRTGYRTTGLLDVHIVTDEDIAKRTSYAVKIDAVTDRARRLELSTGTSD